MKKRTWLIALKKRIRVITLLTLATAASFLLWKFVPWARLYEELSEKYSAFSISDLAPAWYYASIILFAVLLMGLIWRALEVIPKRQARALQGVKYTPHSAVKPTELFEIENEARKTLSQIIGGFIVIVGLILTGANLAITSRLTQEGQITDRFTKAITQLGDRDKLEVRLGGIYALERIAKDSEKDHWTIMEVLMAYVREHSPIKKPNNATKPSSNKRAKDTEQEDDAKLPTDIQAILTVIGRRMISEEREKGVLNFEEMDLSNANLSGTNLRGTNLRGADIGGANLRNADLRGADLRGAILRGAILRGAILTGADLRGAILTGAILIEANLSGAYLNEATLIEADIRGANLRNADLIGAKLSKADLSEADLREAYLLEADLRGAYFLGTSFSTTYYSGVSPERDDFHEVRNLTWEQVSVAIIDDHTKLPAEIEAQHKDELKAMREKTKKEREGK